MNIRGGSKFRIDIKREELRLELNKENPNQEKIRRLKESIRRNKHIANLICRKRKWRKRLGE